MNWVLIDFTTASAFKGVEYGVGLFDFRLANRCLHANVSALRSRAMRVLSNHRLEYYIESPGGMNDPRVGRFSVHLSMLYSNKSPTKGSQMPSDVCGSGTKCTADAEKLDRRDIDSAKSR